MHPAFSDIVTTQEGLRAVLGHASPMVEAKVITDLDVHCRAFIAKSPFLLIASANSRGKVDVSPKGDAPGFVQVLDPHTLAIPERLGNRLADTFSNILVCARVGLLFMIPGKAETLRVSGTAKIVRDAWLLESMAVGGKKPQLATVVTVDRVFFHCAKCVIRSKLWDSDHWPDPAGLPSLARAVIDHAKLTDSVEAVQAVIEDSYRNRLY